MNTNQIEIMNNEHIKILRRDLELFKQDCDKRFDKYEDNYRPTQQNKRDINAYIKEALGQSYEDDEVDKVKNRVLLMFEAKTWQEIPARSLLSIDGMSIVDDSIKSVVSFRTKHQASLFDSNEEYEIKNEKEYPILDK